MTHDFPVLIELPPSRMAEVAPNWLAMRTAIARCERVDEIKELSDKAVALRAYFAQSRDIDNEIAAMRVRLRAERRLGELIPQQQEAGELAKQDGGNRNLDSSVTRLSDLGISHDRSARAQKLASVPEEQFEAALHDGKPSGRSLVALAPPKAHAARSAHAIDVLPVLKTWGSIRDFAGAITDGSLLPVSGWTKHPGILPFQIAEIRAALPVLVDYLSGLALQE